VQEVEPRGHERVWTVPARGESRWQDKEDEVRFIPTNVHGVMDYLMGALLIVAPWLFGFARGGAETWLPVILGAGVILYSFFTDYELGVAKSISMPAHLWLDGLGGALLAVSPWLFGFADLIVWPHLLLGLLEIVAALTTHTRPGGGSAVAG
jgi:hypothetical protein